jgi:hypothetical protein
MTEALTGLLGVFLGICLTELLRRGNRIEAYASQIFGKRMTIYEGLFDLVGICGVIGSRVIEDDDLDQSEREQLV